MNEARRRRLFFGLWPDDATRRDLAALTRRHLPAAAGRPVPARNLHLTLVFLGSVDAEFQSCAERAAGTVRADPFELELCRVGHWARSRVFWTAPAQTPDALTGLVAALSRALAHCGYAPETRAYSAHITLARNVRGPLPGAAHAPVRWRVSDFHLVASETHPRGARYALVTRWPLG